MTKMINAYRTMPADVREFFVETLHNVAAGVSLWGFIATVVYWAPEVASRLH